MVKTHLLPQTTEPFHLYDIFGITEERGFEINKTINKIYQSSERPSDFINKVLTEFEPKTDEEQAFVFIMIGMGIA